MDLKVGEAKAAKVPRRADNRPGDLAPASSDRVGAGPKEGASPLVNFIDLPGREGAADRDVDRYRRTTTRQYI